MPGVNWQIFETLPGSPEKNFEQLCRAVIRIHYEKYGNFISLAQQPGVEFHLQLTSNCSLGKMGDWFGWQCRWYGLASGTNIGSTRRAKISKALATSLAEIPGLTHWVLWTRYPLTKNDQIWFRGLTTKVRLSLKSAEDLEPLLGGDATVLRNTCFGEAILTPSALDNIHTAQISRVRRRWIPEVHQPVNAERELRRMLIEPAAWSRLPTIVSELREWSIGLTIPEKLAVDVSFQIEELRESIEATEKASKQIAAALVAGDIEVLANVIARFQLDKIEQLTLVLRKLRNAHAVAALYATNIVSALEEFYRLLKVMSGYLKSGVIAVVANAGGGKTQLSAELTAPSAGRSAGVFLFGQDLAANDSLNDLSGKISIGGKPIADFETLIAAVDAAGRRGGERLPIVIDGLNEAEDPRKWKAHLASINALVAKYSYALVVCTVRGNELADEALPPEIRRIEVEDFGDDSGEAIRKYFEFYKIRAGDADLPLDMLRHPLTLRLFCDVTNPLRKSVVGIESMPRSLTNLFFKFLEASADRISELSHSSNRLFSQDIKNAVLALGKSMWEANSRSVSEKEFRHTICDDSRQWQHSVVRALEQEGIILRNSSQDESDFGWRGRLGTRRSLAKPKVGTTSLADKRVTFVYDAMAGHVIADVLAVEQGSAAFGKWIKSAAVLKKFDLSGKDRHPLSTDIIQSLAGVLPRSLNGQQLWPLLGEPHRTTALLDVMRMEGSVIDEKTVDELQRLLLTGGTETSSVLTRLFYTRSAKDHPLNAEFLDSTLRGFTTQSRDLAWSEWVREHRIEFEKDARYQQQRWRRTSARTETDRLRAIWLMWLLTSTVHDLRDEATKALYWYGRGAPTDLFAMTLNSLSILDPYVSERMLAASYGVSMALHRSEPEFANKILPQFVKDLFAAMFAGSAQYPTTHALARDYARRTIEIAALHHPAVLDKTAVKKSRPPFRGMKRKVWKTDSGTYSESFRSPIHMDFGNYTIGRLVEGRANYQYDHPEYQEVMKMITWRIKDLGFEQDRFENADSSISRNDFRGRQNRGGGKIDRYGKKYSWIAYFEMAGERMDQGKLKRWSQEHGRISDVDIDPSFPEKPPKLALKIPALEPGASLANWLSRTDAPNTDSLSRRNEIRGQEGPWVLLSGYFHQRDPDKQVGMFCHVRAVFVKVADAIQVERNIKKGLRFDTSEFELPTVYYSFAGEAGWADTWPAMGDSEWKFVVGKTTKTGPKIDFLGVDVFSGEPEPVDKHTPKRMSWSVDVHETVQALIPAVNNGWESYHTCTNDGRCPPVLGREICEALKLHIDPQTCEFREENGKLASTNIQGNEDDEENQEFLYLREDLLNAFLKKTGMQMFVITWGERELHTRDIDALSDMYQKHGTPVFFQTVVKYGLPKRGK